MAAKSLNIFPRNWLFEAWRNSKSSTKNNEIRHLLPNPPPCWQTHIYARIMDWNSNPEMEYYWLGVLLAYVINSLCLQAPGLFSYISQMSKCVYRLS